MTVVVKECSQQTPLVNFCYYYSYIFRIFFIKSSRGKYKYHTKI